MDKIKLVEAAQLRNDIPDFHVGDTINVSVKVIEGDKERIQHFKGILMGIKGSGLSKTFRVRKISNGVGVERIFPFNSPKIAKVEILKEGSIRRAKLYYLRKLTGKAATKIKEKKRKTLEPIIDTTPVTNVQDTPAVTNQDSVKTEV